MSIHEDKNIFFEYIWCDLLVELFDNKVYYNKIIKYISHYDIKSNSYMIFYIYHQIFTKILKINKNIINKVNKFVNTLHKKGYIGIQMRVGNADLNEKQYSDNKDIELMLNIAKRNSYYKIWFITGDSIKLKKELKRKYSEICLYSKNKTNHYKNNKKDSSIVIEHEILSKSNMIIISESTYGLTALLKSGIMLNNGYLGYEIKKGRIYNVKSNFKNITSFWHIY